MALALLLATVLLGGCVELPERLDALADSSREFAVVHPVVTGAALMAARAALHKPQHVGVVCNPHCGLASNPGIDGGRVRLAASLTTASRGGGGSGAELGTPILVTPAESLAPYRAARIELPALAGYEVFAVASRFTVAPHATSDAADTAVHRRRCGTDGFGHACSALKGRLNERASPRT